MSTRSFDHSMRAFGTLSVNPTVVIFTSRYVSPLLDSDLMARSLASEAGAGSIHSRCSCPKMIGVWPDSKTSPCRQEGSRSGTCLHWRQVLPSWAIGARWRRRPSFRVVSIRRRHPLENRDRRERAAGRTGRVQPQLYHQQVRSNSSQRTDGGVQYSIQR